MTEKVCILCSMVLSLDLFVKDKRTKDGIASRCKSCDDLQKLKYRADNQEKSRAYFKERYAKYRIENPARVPYTEDEIKARRIESRRLYADRNRCALNAKAREKAKTPERKVYMASKVREYQAKKRNAVPSWTDGEFEQLVFIEAYDLAKKRESVTGFKWHVDHIVPLQSKLVCGLHCASNINVIPALENIRKHNRHWPDMP